VCSCAEHSLSKLGLAFPPSDQHIATFLTQPSPGSAVDERYYLNFLAHVFQQVANELNTAFPNAEKRPYDDLAAKWRAHLDGPAVREMLYHSIVCKATTKWNKEMSGCDTEVSLRSQASAYESSFLIVTVLQVLSGDAHRAFESLSRAIDQRVEKPDNPKGKPDDHMIVMYFDESHALSEATKSGKTHYDHLARALNRLLAHPIFTIFLSTNSHINQLAPSPGMARSARARNDPFVLQAPITELPFDCSPEFPLKPGMLTLASTSTIPFMAQFGRPL
jgi:hypothetical protein